MRPPPLAINEGSSHCEAGFYRESSRGSRTPEGMVPGGEGVKKLVSQLSVFRKDKLL